MLLAWPQNNWFGFSPLKDWLYTCVLLFINQTGSGNLTLLKLPFGLKPGWSNVCPK